MSYIPDTRNKMKVDPYKGITEELNPYWHRILEGADADCIEGYDWAVEFLENTLDDLIEDAMEVITSSRYVNYTHEEKKKEIKDHILEMMEANRDEIVVSLIDNMDQADYDRRFEEVRERPQDEDCLTGG